MDKENLYRIQRLSNHYNFLHTFKSTSPFFVEVSLSGSFGVLSDTHKDEKEGIHRGTYNEKRIV